MEILHVLALLVNFLFIQTTLSSPITTEDLIPRDGEKDAYLEPIREAYRGIYWEDAYDNCSPDNLAQFVEATRMSLELTNVQNEWQSAPFNRFFVRPQKASYNGDWYGPGWTGLHDDFLAIRSNIKQAGTMPRMGRPDRNGNFPRRRQIKYSCAEVAGLNKCAKNPKLGGYTTTPGLTPDGWTIVLCPRWFNKERYVNDITKGSPKKLSDLPTLYSKEHVMIHEWMHADVLGTKFHIEDVKGNIPGQPDGQTIYGASLCFEYAWRNMPTSVNWATSRNADNYAWFFTNYWYMYKTNWGWNDDGSQLNTKKRGLLDARQDDAGDDAPVLDGDDLDDMSVSEVDLQQKDSQGMVNCQSDGDDNLDDAVCDYVGEEWGDYVKDRTQDFDSNGGCNLSHFCWDSFSGGGVDPQCVCTCGGEMTPLSDQRCAGYAGFLPDPPSNGASANQCGTGC